jgi:hypothetical protein
MTSMPRDLSFITRYPDRQSRGDRFLFGYHGKGAYTGQGRFVVANNGRPDKDIPTGPAGVLATWDGTTVAANGGSYATTDPNQPPRPTAATPRRPARLHRRLDPCFQNPALRGHRPRRHFRQPESRHRSDLVHRLRREVGVAACDGKPAVEPLATAQGVLLARRLARLAHRVAAHPPA